MKSLIFTRHYKDYINIHCCTEKRNDVNYTFKHVSNQIQCEDNHNSEKHISNKKI